MSEKGRLPPAAPCPKLAVRGPLVQHALHRIFSTGVKGGERTSVQLVVGRWLEPANAIVEAGFINWECVRRQLPVSTSEMPQKLKLVGILQPELPFAVAGDTWMAESEQITALEENLWSHWAQFGRPVGCSLVDEPDMLRFDTPITSLPYNGVVRFRGDAVASRVGEIVSHYRRRAVGFMWLIHPTAPSALNRQLELHGLSEAEICSGMVAAPRALTPLAGPPDGVVIREIDPADEETVLELVAWRWNAPPDAIPKLSPIFRSVFGQAGSPTRGWLAMIDGVPVAKAFTHSRDGVVGLYGVATKPEARGGGLARCLCLKALHESARPDTRLLVLHSSPMAASLYRKMGFDEVAPFRVFVAGGELHV